MEFRVKIADVEVLRKYGFKSPKEWIASGALEGTNVIVRIHEEEI